MQSCIIFSLFLSIAYTINGSVEKDLTCVLVPEIDPQVTVCVNLKMLEMETETEVVDERSDNQEFADYFFTDPLDECPDGSVVVSSAKECKEAATPYLQEVHGKQAVPRFHSVRLFNKHPWPCGCFQQHKPQWVGKVKFILKE